ncbi:MAG: sulfotransferase [Alphaproteobacteria bacterium]|nr:sulfotransferase [Alphaproteobacteria bacterium]
MADGRNTAETGTAGRLRSGLAHHQAGRLDLAEAEYRAVLARAPDNGNANNLLCALYLQRGDAPAAAEFGQAAVAAKPDVADFWNNYGAALRRDGQLTESADAFEEALRRNPALVDARLNLAGVQAETGAFDRAAANYREAISKAPERTQAHINLGNTLRAAGDIDGAIRAWRAAVNVAPAAAEGWINLVAGLSDVKRFDEAGKAFDAARAAGVKDASLFANRARMDLLRGSPDVAAGFAREGLAIDGGHVGCAVALAMARVESGDAEGAEALARQVVSNAPDRAEGWTVLGVALERLRRTDEAVTAYGNALERAPDDVEARANLADLHERTNSLEHAQALIDRALEIAPEHPFANRVAATLARRRGDIAQAIERLEPLAETDAPPGILQGIRFELGRLHDREGDATQAFRHFTEANRIQSESLSARRFDPARYRADIQAMRDVLTPEWVSGWTTIAPPGGDTPVFLVGFPRSGTTLLDQMLDSHPGIQVAEEKPMMEELKRRATENSGYPAELAGMPEVELSCLQELYWQRAETYLPRESGRLFVDKLPLNLEKVVLIHRVFPDARFILALRHPADCVLSCFMQAFRPNIAMNNFNSLEDAARLYDQVFGLWEQARELLPLDVHRIRYEDVVADMRSEIERLLEFLGLPWDEAVLDYMENAQRRGRINTPSYNQVTEPIYTRASGRWTRYRDQMADALEILGPWAARYGYDI